MIVKTVELVDLIEMRNTDCFGETRLVPHVPSSKRILLLFMLLLLLLLSSSAAGTSTLDPEAGLVALLQVAMGVPQLRLPGSNLGDCWNYEADLVTLLQVPVGLRQLRPPGSSLGDCWNCMTA